MPSISHPLVPMIQEIRGTQISGNDCNNFVHCPRHSKSRSARERWKWPRCGLKVELSSRCSLSRSTDSDGKAIREQSQLPMYSTSSSICLRILGFMSEQANALDALVSAISPASLSACRSFTLTFRSTFFRFALANSRVQRGSGRRLWKP